MSYERVPATRSNKQFPIGDVFVDTRQQKKMTDLFLRIEEMDLEEYSGHVRFHHAPTSQDGERAFATHQAAKNLCRAWDGYRDNSRPFAEVGYNLAMTFNRQAHLLPICKLDLTTELTQMREQQADLALEFAEFAWEGMEAYPNVLSVYDRLLEIGRTKFNLDSEIDREYFKAGMALPYVFAWTDRLIGYTRTFNVMVDEQHSLEGDDFLRYFKP